MRTRHVHWTVTCVVSSFLWGLGCAPSALVTPQRKMGLFDHEGLPSDFRWPLARVEVTSPFGKRGHKNHEGIDLRAASGTEIFAAKRGVVLYSDQKIRGYGRMVVVRHDSGIATIYAHNSENLVKKGDRVRQGQTIALVGATGHATGSHLHFEVRKGVMAIDPEQLISLPLVAEAPILARAARPSRSSNLKFAKAVRTKGIRLAKAQSTRRSSKARFKKRRASHSKITVAASLVPRNSTLGYGDLPIPSRLTAHR